ncbi:MAG: hypothetical protein HYY43_04715 [Deltaproteobacteria bacterium]|nr:hypothetical protein [Deltaproteobacteria bacterium]MBI2974873.1 hypothetical protein [Deltaproteobacteria bacterium]
MKQQMNRLAHQGEKIYKQILNKLLLEAKGKFAAIDIQSSEYFIGNSLLETVTRAKEKYPDRKFHIVRIGHRAAVSFKHRCKP